MMVTLKSGLILKKNIKLTKDIYGTSVKSNSYFEVCICKWYRTEIIYDLLEEMDLRKPF